VNGAESFDSEAVLRIAEGLDVVVINDNEVLVQFGSKSYPSQLLRDTDLTGVLGRVFHRFQTGTATRGEMLSAIASEHRDEVVRLLDSLSRQGILVDSDKSPVEQYIAYTFTQETRLTDRSVCLIGAGPLGARIAETLLQHGVGTIKLLEGRQPDAVWRGHPGPGYSSGSTSTRPVQSELRDHLCERGYAGVESYETSPDERALENSITGSDIAVLALEQPDIRLAHLVNRVCIGAGKRWIHVTLDGNLGVVGPLFVPGETACYNDFRTLLDAAGSNPQMSRLYRRYATERGAVSFSPGLPAHADIVGGFASLGVVHWLLSSTCYLLGRALVVNFDRMTIDVEDVLKLPRCPVCARWRFAYQPPFSAEAVTRASGDGEGHRETRR
jgi:bacteriocin biosynthesis cyclodehydratase domain-containing protein